MPRGDRDRDRKRTNRDLARRAKKRVCIFCKEHIDWVDYKDVNLLRRFMSDRGKIRARRVSGNCAQHQREVAVAIKTARELALLPYSQRTTTERTGPRGMRGAPPPPAEPAGDAAEDGAGADIDVDVEVEVDELADVGVGDEIDADAVADGDEAVDVEAPAE